MNKPLKVILISFCLILLIAFIELFFVSKLDLTNLFFALFNKQPIPTQYTNPNGKSIPLGYSFTSADKQVYFLVGILSGVNRTNTSIYADILTTNEANKQISQRFLVYNKNDQLNFYIKRQSTHNLIPNQNEYQTQILNNIDDIFKELESIRTKDILLTIRLSPPDISNPNSDQQNIINVFKKYASCNTNLFNNELKTKYSLSLQCIPYAYQFSVYAK